MQSFEKIYQKLCEQEWEEDDEPDFPFEYKINFIKDLAILFCDNGVYTRSEKLLQLLKNLSEKYPDSKEVSLAYILTYLSRVYDSWSVYAQTPEEYFKPIEEIIAKTELSENDKKDIEFKKRKTQCDYWSLTDLESGTVHIEKMMEMCTQRRVFQKIDESDIEGDRK